MAARQGTRPGGGGARFAQFKLVLLGMSLAVPRLQHMLVLTPCRRISCGQELARSSLRQGMVDSADLLARLRLLTPR